MLRTYFEAQQVPPHIMNKVVERANSPLYEDLRPVTVETIFEDRCIERIVIPEAGYENELIVRDHETVEALETVYGIAYIVYN